jgi:hypothetical protein
MLLRMKNYAKVIVTTLWVRKRESDGPKNIINFVNKLKTQETLATPFDIKDLKTQLSFWY